MSIDVKGVSQMSDQDRRRDRVRELLPELQQIGDEGLREAVTEIWLRAWTESGWDDMAAVPKNPSATRAAASVDDAWTLITHTRVVAQVAAASADIVAKLHGTAYDLDTVIALALLHDVSKLLEYEGTENSVAKSRFAVSLPPGDYLFAAALGQFGRVETKFVKQESGDPRLACHTLGILDVFAQQREQRLL